MTNWIPAYSYTAHATAFASDQDRRWFEEHPFATEYYRRPFEGEFGPDTCCEGKARVRVVNVPGKGRMRVPNDHVNASDPEELA